MKMNELNYFIVKLAQAISIIVLVVGLGLIHSAMGERRRRKVND